METSNEHFQPGDIDTQIEQSLARAQPDDPDTQLVTDLQRLYQPAAQADEQSINYAWQHIHIRSRSQRSQQTERKIIPMHTPSSHIPGTTQSRSRPARRFASIQRTFALIAAVLVTALLVGTLLTMLSQSRVAQNKNTRSASTPVAKPTRVPTTQAQPGHVVYSHKVNDDIIMGLQWSPDGKGIVLVGNNAHIWDATTGKNEITYQPSGGGKTPIQNVAWEPHNSQRIAIGTDTVQVVDANTGHLLTTGPKSATANIGTTFTSLLVPLLPHSQGSPTMRAIAWSPDGKLIASSLDDPTNSSHNPQEHPILIWNSSTGNVVKTLIGHTADVERLAWSPDGKYIASLSVNWDPAVRVWNASTGQLIYTVNAKSYSAMLNVAWSPDSQFLAVSMTVQDGNNTLGEIKVKQQIQIWKALTGTPVLTYPLAPSINPVQYLAWSHDGTRIASVETGLQTISSGPDKGQQISVQNVAIWNPITGKKLFTYQQKSGDMRGITWSPDDTLLASASLITDVKNNTHEIDVNFWEAPAK
ncbi:hypothetical protein KDA_68260 [Dictyobacter alpinus]|uniref:Uncharacterized protein n=1 Tax=Dictyobacter alpinus TaxID=2014873 RepID=A0A402BJ88_9CHLR|nr:PD40 domain-containing protein [Dictyobacter alpinus]GCE31342.1 hypothetical protein KDA_68260 [Dictyobacter alpinus]